MTFGIKKCYLYNAKKFSYIERVASISFINILKGGGDSMDRWGLICIILSGVIGLIREWVRVENDGITILYKVLWCISLILLVLGSVLYFML